MTHIRKLLKVNPDLWQAVKVRAAQDGKPMWEVVELAIRAYLNRETRGFDIK